MPMRMRSLRVRVFTTVEDSKKKSTVDSPRSTVIGEKSTVHGRRSTVSLENLFFVLAVVCGVSKLICFLAVVCRPRTVDF